MHWTRMRAQQDGPSEKVVVIAIVVCSSIHLLLFFFGPRVMSYTGLVVEMCYLFSKFSDGRRGAGGTGYGSPPSPLL